MTTPELVQFVKNEIAVGASRQLISDKLKTQGWDDTDINEVFNIVSPVVAVPTTFNSIPVMASITNGGPLVVEQKPKRKLLKFFTIFIIILILVAGGALAYASGYFLTTSKLFSQMTDSSKNNKTVKFDLNLNVDASAMKIPESSISLGTGDAKTADFNMTGAFDMADTTKLKFDSSYVFKMGKIDAEIAVRAIGGSLYLNLTKGPDLGFFSLKPFENRWVSIPMTNKDGKLDTANPLLSVSPVNSSFLNSLTDEQKQHITDIVKKASLIKITKKHLPEMVDGAISYHISFDIDKVGVVSFLTELADYMKSLDKSNDALAGLSPADISKSLDAISSFDGGLWVGILDKLPHKIVISSTIINPEKPEDGNVKILATLLYKDWNKPVIVEVPIKVVTVEELMKELFGGMVGGTQTNTNNGDITLTQDDYKKQNVITLMKSAAEVYHDDIVGNNTYKGFCSSKGDSGAYKLAITLPKGSTYKCNDVASSWAASVKLSTGEYFCVDNTGTAKSSIILPTETVCPK